MFTFKIISMYKIYESNIIIFHQMYTFLFTTSLSLNLDFCVRLKYGVRKMLVDSH